MIRNELNDGRFISANQKLFEQQPTTVAKPKLQRQLVQYFLQWAKTFADVEYNNRWEIRILVCYRASSKPFVSYVRGKILSFLLIFILFATLWTRLVRQLLGQNPKKSLSAPKLRGFDFRQPI